MSEATQIIGFGPESLWIFFGVLIGLAIIVVLWLDLIIKVREVRKPKVNDEQTIQDRLSNDHKRLKALEDKTKEQDKELRLILRSQMDILHHLVDGNGTEKMKKTQTDIENYLITGEVEERKE
ncbi:MAG: hypothetical protein IJ188_08410 [Clostridia bacterium]|nr:hypothetical protein [Clostridia bacterium]